MRRELPPANSTLCIYVDESGNTGDAALTSSLWGSQPSFALVGIGEVDGSNCLERIWTTIRGELGVAAKELKGRAMDRRPQLLFRLLQALSDAEIPIFAELMDKEFYVTNNIVTYALGISRMPSSTFGIRHLANAFADTITEELRDPVITAYSGFAREPSRVTFDIFVSTFRAELQRARAQAVHSEQAMILSTIDQLFEDEVSQYDGSKTEEDARYGLLLPPPDQTGRGKVISMLPHVPAFTHLCARVNFFAPDGHRVRVVHDQQLQVGPILDDYADTLASNEFAEELTKLPQIGIARWRFATERFSLSFQDSKDSSGVQIADILARYFTRRLNAAIKNDADPDDPILPILDSMSHPEKGLGINLVTTTRRAERFWGSNMRRLVFR